MPGRNVFIQSEDRWVSATQVVKWDVFAQPSDILYDAHSSWSCAQAALVNSFVRVLLEASPSEKQVQLSLKVEVLDRFFRKQVWSGVGFKIKTEFLLPVSDAVLASYLPPVLHKHRVPVDLTHDKHTVTGYAKDKTLSKCSAVSQTAVFYLHSFVEQTGQEMKRKHGHEIWSDTLVLWRKSVVLCVSNTSELSLSREVFDVTALMFVFVFMSRDKGWALSIKSANNDVRWTQSRFFASLQQQPAIVFADSYVQICFKASLSLSLQTPLCFIKPLLHLKTCGLTMSSIKF